DVGRLKRVRRGEERQAGILGDRALDLPSGDGARRHNKDAYHADTGAWARRTQAATADAGTASARPPCIMVLTPTIPPAVSPRGRAASRAARRARVRRCRRRAR